jgi:CheY-like chemotaxis protein
MSERKTYRVLLAQDTEEVLARWEEFFAKLAQQKGEQYEIIIDSATGYGEAMEDLRKNQYDLMIADYYISGASLSSLNSVNLLKKHYEDIDSSFPKQIFVTSVEESYSYKAAEDLRQLTESVGSKVAVLDKKEIYWMGWKYNEPPSLGSEPESLEFASYIDSTFGTAYEKNIRRLKGMKRTEKNQVWYNADYASIPANILLVNDKAVDNAKWEQQIRKIHENGKQQRPLNIITATSSEQAIELMKEYKLELVVMDYYLNDDNAIDLIEKMNREDDIQGIYDVFVMSRNIELSQKTKKHFDAKEGYLAYEGNPCSPG